MAEPVTPLSPEEVTKQVAAAEHESLPHRVIEMADATVRSAYGPQDETISSGDAEDVLQASGAKKQAALTLDRVLNLFSRDHGEKAMIADYVRAVLEERRLAGYLDPQTLATIQKAMAQ